MELRRARARRTEERRGKWKKLKSKRGPKQRGIGVKRRAFPHSAGRRKTDTKLPRVGKGKGPTETEKITEMQNLEGTKG